MICGVYRKLREMGMRKFWKCWVEGGGEKLIIITAEQSAEEAARLVLEVVLGCVFDV